MFTGPQVAFESLVPYNMKTLNEKSGYVRPVTAVCRQDDIALICDSFDGDNENYNQEEFQW